MHAQRMGVSCGQSVRELFAGLAAAPNAHRLMGVAWQWFEQRTAIDVLGLATLGAPEPTGYLYSEGRLDSATEDWLWEELVQGAMVARPEPGSYPRRRADRLVWRGLSTKPVVLDQPVTVGPWTVMAARAPAAIVQGWQGVATPVDPEVSAALAEGAALAALFMRNIQWMDVEPRFEPPADFTFEELMEHEVSRATRSRAAVSLVLVELCADDGVAAEADAMVDLHEEAEKVVRETARSGDYVRRISDACLAVIMPKTDARNALVGADRLQRTLQQHFADNMPGLAVRIGIGGRDPEETQASELFARASQALADARVARGEAAFLHI